MSNPARLASAVALLLALTLLHGVVVPSPAHAQDVIGTSGAAIRLDVSKGTLIRLARSASTVFVANPAIADVQVKSPRIVYLTAKQPGETVVYAVDANDRIIMSRTVSVGHNLSRLRAALRNLIPNSNLDVQSIDNTLVLTGSVKTSKDAASAEQMVRRQVKRDKDLVNNISVVAPNQVHLRVRVTEVSRDTLKQFGVNWDTLFRSGGFLFGFATAFSSVPNAGLALGSYSDSTSDINTLIDALDDEGMIKILAEPNLTAVSGESATFLAGGEFPVIVPEKEDKVSVEFKEFGVSLAFTPVLVGNRISLKVRPEVSQLSTEGAVELNGFTIPALTTRRAETTVELGSGQSFAIAGLLQNNTERNIEKLPGLGDLPILGTLFRSDRFKRKETELVIIVTPYIVRPVEPGRLMASTDGLKPPNDVDRLLRGRMHKPHLDSPPKPVHGRGARGGLAGPAGFIME